MVLWRNDVVPCLHQPAFEQFMQQLVGLDDNDATPLAHSIFPRRINAAAFQVGPPPASPFETRGSTGICRFVPIDVTTDTKADPGDNSGTCRSASVAAQCSLAPPKPRRCPPSKRAASPFMFLRSTMIRRCGS